MSFIQGLASVYVLVLFIFTLGFLINWYRNRTAISPYKRIGFWAGLIFVIFELLTLALAGGMFLAANTVLIIVVALGWGILRIWGFVNNGIFFSNQLNIRSFPLIAPRLGLLPAPAPVETPALEEIPASAVEAVTPGVDTPIVAEVVPPEPIEPVATAVAPIEPEPIAPPAPPPTNWTRYWLNILGIGLGAVAYSAVLFLITQPRAGLVVQDVVSPGEPIMTPLTLVVLLEFSFVEELMFRLGIQNYLGAKLMNRRYGYAIAVTLTAALWAMAHIGSLDPDWIKMAQIFPLGLALGWLYRRQGTESTIMAHALFNLVGGLVLSPLYLR
ncbi:MAG TPA: CPBP family intramembrane glutamic endopeptidase [Anaerolineae bacterium]|nr:CPBP family intramembrane glutamic endopeptidase [Anaerolineae bacterium]